MNKLVFISISVLLFSLVDFSVGFLSGAIYNEGLNKTRVLINALCMLILIINSFLIKRWVYQHSEGKLFRQLSYLSLIAIVFCFFGDIVNFNLPQEFHQHSDLIRHDYLADSVFFFAPGYLLFIIAALQFMRVIGIKLSTIVYSLLAAILIGSISFLSMHLPGTGLYVSLITGLYSLQITVVGVMGILLIYVFRDMKSTQYVWFVGVGYILAMVADAVIGQFWIYGNNGQGYFPLVREVNWIIYISSQCLIIHLPRMAVLEFEKQKQTVS